MPVPPVAVVERLDAAAAVPDGRPGVQAVAGAVAGPPGAAVAPASIPAAPDAVAAVPDAEAEAEAEARPGAAVRRAGSAAVREALARRLVPVLLVLAAAAPRLAYGPSPE